jgi:hypothetical protein
MAKSFSVSGMFANLFKKNDLFLLGLLVASLALNVYLGWSLKRLPSTAPAPPEAIRISPGTTVRPVQATSLNGQQETISYADAGKPTVFYVFSPSCIWCERNTENINAIARQKGEAFRFIGLSLADDGLPGYVKSHQFSFPVYKNLPPESMQTLGLGPTPQTIVISPGGQVLKNWVGAYVPTVQPQVEEFFNVRLPGVTAQPK